jgi:CTP synthase (UTP-ammonia lyase)
MVRVGELPTHPFYLGTLFQPELVSDETSIHPVLHAFATAARERVAMSGR